MSRRIHCLIIHCSDSDIPAHDNIETIRKWHVEERGFTDVGYNYFVDKRGNVSPGRTEETVGAHCRGHNSGSIGICLSGRHDFTGDQFRALEALCRDICKRYDLEKTQILAHADLDKNKTCPNFDVHALVSSWLWH